MDRICGNLMKFVSDWNITFYRQFGKVCLVSTSISGNVVVWESYQFLHPVVTALHVFEP